MKQNSELLVLNIRVISFGVVLCGVVFDCSNGTQVFCCAVKERGGSFFSL
jgi:hypothetical protein